MQVDSSATSSSSSSQVGLGSCRRALSPLEENYVKSTEGGSGIIVYGILLKARERGSEADLELDVRHVVRATEMVMERHPMLGAEIVVGEERKMWVQLVGDGKLLQREMLGEFNWVEEKPWPGRRGEKDGQLLQRKEEEEEWKEEAEEDDDGYGHLRRALAQELNTHFVKNVDGLPRRLFKVCFYTSPTSPFKALVLRLHNALFDSASARIVGRDVAAAAIRAAALPSNGHHHHLDDHNITHAHAHPNTITNAHAPPSPSANTNAHAIIPNNHISIFNLKHNSDACPLPLPIEDLLPKSKLSKNFMKRGIETVSYLLKAKNWRLLPFHHHPLVLRNSTNITSSNTTNIASNDDDDDDESIDCLCINDNNYHLNINNNASARIRTNNINTLSSKQQHRPSFRSNLISLSLGVQGTKWLFTACEREGIPWRVALITSFLKATTIAMNTSKCDKLHEFAFGCVMDCRGTLEPPMEQDKLGNYVLSLLMAAKVNGEKVDFWDLAHHVAQSIDKDTLKGKHITKMPLLNMLFSEVIKHPSMTPSSSCRTMLFSLFMDKPLKESWSSTEEIHILGTLGPLTSLHFVGPCFSISETLIKGSELLLTLVYPSPLYSHDRMLRFLTSTIDILHMSTKSRS